MAELGSFSRAADARAITQPAMSRHIKGLEDHLGFSLIDRTNFPATLTTEGEEFRVLAQQTLASLDSGINQIKQQARRHQSAVRFSMQHVLAAEFFSHWWQQFDIDIKTIVHVDANNLHDCVQQLENDHCDFLICYHHPSISITLDAAEFASIKIGQDSLVPVSGCLPDGTPKFHLERSDLLPVVGSGDTDFMGKVVDHILVQNQAEDRFHKVYEDSFSEGVKSQALLGTGLAWLPLMLVEKDLAAGRLSVLGDEHWQQDLEIFLYCRPERLAGIPQTIWHQIVPGK